MSNIWLSLSILRMCPIKYLTTTVDDNKAANKTIHLKGDKLEFLNPEMGNSISFLIIKEWQNEQIVDMGKKSEAPN